MLIYAVIQSFNHVTAAPLIIALLILYVENVSTIIYHATGMIVQIFLLFEGENIYNHILQDRVINIFCNTSDTGLHTEVLNEKIHL